MLFLAAGMLCGPLATNKLGSALFAAKVVPRPRHEVHAESTAAKARGYLVLDVAQPARDTRKLVVAELDSFAFGELDKLLSQLYAECCSVLPYTLIRGVKPFCLTLGMATDSLLDCNRAVSENLTRANNMKRIAC